MSNLVILECERLRNELEKAKAELHAARRILRWHKLEHYLTPKLIERCARELRGGAVVDR